jgi:hypothetical protein
VHKGSQAAAFSRKSVFGNGAILTAWQRNPRDVPHESLERHFREFSPENMIPKSRKHGAFPAVLGGDLNPPLGFYFPLFSMSFAREFPSGWQSVEGSGIKIVVFL